MHFTVRRRMGGLARDNLRTTAQVDASTVDTTD